MLLAIAGACGLLHALHRVGSMYAWMFALPIFVIAAAAPDTTNALLKIGPVGLTFTEVATFSNLFGQVMSLVVAGFLFALTTHPEDLFSALVELRVPRGIAFAFVGGLQFAPFLRHRVLAIRNAQISRGVPADGTLRQRVGAIGPTLRPLLLGALDEIHEREVILLLRGFASEANPTVLRVLRFRVADRWWIIAGSSLVAASILIVVIT